MGQSGAAAHARHHLSAASHRSEGFGDPAKGIVVGTAIGYGYAQIATFLESLDTSGFGGVVVLSMADDLDTLDRAVIEALGVTILSVSPTPWISSSRGRVARVVRGVSRTAAPRSARLALTIQGPLSRRWLLYRHMAAGMPNEFTGAPWVFLTDVRDVRFQGDPMTPFGRLAESGPLHLFAEGRPGADATDPAQCHGATLIGEQPWNADWIEYVGGVGARGRLASRQVLCAGTILVSPTALDPLAVRMIGGMGTNRTRTAPLGVDQGVMNFLFHTGEFDDLEPTVHANADGGVFTMGTCPTESWSLVDGQVRVNGSPPQVVHQYDRFDQVAAVWHADR